MKRLFRTLSLQKWISDMAAMPYGKLATLYVALILGCAALYFGLSSYAPSHAPNVGALSDPLGRLLNSLYFSTITATSVGYGDIVPHGFSKVLAAVQSVWALFVFAVLVSKPISQRQEVALYQIHRLTFDDIFTSTREGFFIMRKDFDHVIEETERTQNVSDRSWENLATAYRQGQVLLEEIPKFYDTEKKLYIIDMRREGLLLDAVERTIERMLVMFKAFDKAGVMWRTNARSMEQLHEFLRFARVTISQWHRQSPHDIEAAFSELEGKISLVSQLVKTAI